MTSAKTQVQLVTPSLVLTVGREPVQLHCEKLIPGSRSWCTMRKIFLVVRAIQRWDVLLVVVAITFVTRGIPI